MSMSMRSDCASTPIRGSRLVGLDSMSITAVSGSGLPPHPARSTRAMAAAATVLRQIRLDIRDLAEDCRMRCAGGCRNVSRQAVPRLPCEECEGDSLFGFGGDAVLVGGLDLASEGREIGSEHAHKRLITRAATGHDVVNWRIADARRNELLVGERDAARGKRGGSGQDVMR